ncbi:hypothetical protein IGI04_019410 [Brassica rapa subsp. trilocularis]|uniref:Uncharacterized protein n=1 Tax=Brassica rapa subsp. trilocularis TaxID=1813537 RepID=A0ABQ7MJ70_BRACM|nr:hypothetical protein IGI04_019410 [Brassica rapa subsp. trilocularis]
MQLVIQDVISKQTGHSSVSFYGQSPSSCLREPLFFASSSASSLILLFVLSPLVLLPPL